MKEKTLHNLKKFQPKCIMLLLAMMLFLLFPVQAQAAKYPSSIKLNRTTMSGYYGGTFTLKATISPKTVEVKTVKWKSDNTKVATVDSKGKVKFTGTGSAKITATTANGKKAVCTVKAVLYKTSSKYIKIGNQGGVRQYKIQASNWYGGGSRYYKDMGCVTTAVSIAASGFGKYYTPAQIHTGPANKSYSERYAVKKMGASASLYGWAAISVRTASQILTDLKITNKARYTFNLKSAEKEIVAHLKKGKPVIVKANTNYYGGAQFAYGHHAIVLLGIGPDGYLTYMDTSTGLVNYAHKSGTYVRLKPATLLSHHMNQASGNVNAPYVIDAYGAGGYILVG